MYQDFKRKNINHIIAEKTKKLHMRLPEPEAYMKGNPWYQLRLQIIHNFL
jgi:hypothetical protein